MHVATTSMLGLCDMSKFCKKATQTNMEESERDTERGNSEQEKDSDQPRQNQELVPKRGATSVAFMRFGYEKSDTDQKTVLWKLCRRPVPTTDSNTTNLFYHLRKSHVKPYGERVSRWEPQKYSRVLKTNLRLKRCKGLRNLQKMCYIVICIVIWI